MTPLRALFLTFTKETFRHPLSLALPPLFLLITSFTFSLALRNAHSLLPSLLTPVLIVTSLLAVLLSADSLFKPLLTSHTLPLLFLHPSSLSYALITRILSHWLFHIFPTLLLTPLIALFFFTHPYDSLSLLPTLIIHSFSITLLSAFINALTLGLPSFAFIATLLILPLATPLLIFTLLSLSHSPSSTTAFLALAASIPILIILHILFTPSLLRYSLSSSHPPH